MMQLLFSRVSIFDVLQLQEQALKDELKDLDAKIVNQTPEEELVQRLAARYKLAVPVLDEDGASMSHREVNVDVSRDPRRFIIDRDRPFHVKGTEITISVPFKGNPEMFQVRPTSYTLNPPRGEVRGHEIALSYTRTDDNSAAVKSEYQQTILEIKKHLEWLETSVAEFNSRVGQQVRAQLAQRKQRLVSQTEFISGIGIPIKQTGTGHTVETKAAPESLRKSINSPKKWDVFISHSSEDKEHFVRPLAQALRDQGIAVWYDEFSLKIGDSLRSSIDYGLANSRYGVVVLSKSFFAKHWPVQELNGLSSREVDGKKVILPIWHNVGFDEVREFSPMLADKMASSSDKGLDHVVADIMAALDRS